MEFLLDTKVVALFLSFPTPIRQQFDNYSQSYGLHGKQVKIFLLNLD
jgi:hypothetical protein